MKKIFVIGFAFVFAAMALVSCNMDFYASNSMTADQLAQDPNAPQYTTDGVYTLFQNRIKYKGQTDGESGNYYIRHYFQMTELRGDNVTVSGITEDPFINPYRYADDNTKKNIYYTWWMAYKIINSANANLAYIPETSDFNKHLIGENYFLRAIAHFHMVTLFARPYTQGTENLGVPIRQEVESTTTSRATVGEVYNAIVEDLVKAQEYMAFGEKERIVKSNKSYKSYATLDAATALLARVYLYMGENDKCIEECDKLMAHKSASLDGYDFADYPTHTYDHPETIWCIQLDPDHEWAKDHGEASIASMYFKAPFLTADNKASSIGWGEHYWSENLIDLFRRYPSDLRFNAYFRMIDPTPTATQKKADPLIVLKTYDEMFSFKKRTVIFPVPGGDGDEYCTGSADLGCKVNADGSVNFQTLSDELLPKEEWFDKFGDGTEMVKQYKKYDHVAKLKIEHGVDTIYYVENSDPNFKGVEIDGVKRVWVRPGSSKPKQKVYFDDETQKEYTESPGDAEARYKALIARVDNAGFYMRYYNLKFSYQDGKPMMSSPVFLRWGEVLLNRAEAYAKTGEEGKALDDINVIRTRAGIPALTSGDVANLGYSSMLDLVLDERRTELCFEGHRAFDVYRNNRPLDRRYIGYHTWEIIEPTDPRVAMLISMDEINAAGIPQNPR